MKFGASGRGRSQQHGPQGLAFLQGTRLWQIQGRSARASHVPSVALLLELSESRETRDKQSCRDKMRRRQVGGTTRWNTGHRCSPWKSAKTWLASYGLCIAEGQCEHFQEATAASPKAQTWRSPVFCVRSSASERWPPTSLDIQEWTSGGFWG